MLATILSAFTVADIRKKLAFTAALLAPLPARRAHPRPGHQHRGGRADPGELLQRRDPQPAQHFSGGSLARIALFALGIMPYITASIIMQLLTVVVPSLEQLQREGEIGTQRITQYTRYLTVGLAGAQAIAYVFLFRSFQAQAGLPVVTNFGLPKLTLIAISLTAGCMLVMWMGELITQRGIGNGISLMIFASHRRGPAARRAGLVDEPGPRLQGDDAVPRARRDRRGRVRAGGPAPHPGPVRAPRDRPAHDAGRPDLPAAAREHGGRDPGHLRGEPDGLPADGRPADQHAVGERRRELLQPGRARPT